MYVSSDLQVNLNCMPNVVYGFVFDILFQLELIVFGLG